MFEQLHPNLFAQIFDYLTQSELYNMLLTFNKTIFQHIENYPLFNIETKEQLKPACRMNYFISIKLLLDKNKTKQTRSYILRKACKYAHQNLIDLIIRTGNFNVNEGLIGACRGGHIPIAMEMMQLGAKYVNNGLYKACQGGHEDMVKFLLLHGANKVEWGFRGACYGGHEDLVEIMLMMGAKKLNKGFAEACSGGQLETVKMLVDNIPPDIIDLHGLYEAIKNGHLSIVRWNIEDFGFHPDTYYVYYAYKYKHNHIADYFISLPGWNVDYVEILNWAVFHNEGYILEEIKDHVSKFELNRVFASMCRFRKTIEIMRLLIEYGADSCSNCGGTMQEHLEPPKKKRKLQN